MTWLLSLWLSAVPAFATDVSEGEHMRLSEDLKQLASRQLWQGVEKKFQELEKLGVELSYADLLYGAHAARALGNTRNAYDRLKRAVKLDGTKEVVDWLFAIDSNYGPVELVAHNPKGVVLACDEIPFDPDQRLSVEAAIDIVKHEGSFTGLLPKGRYTYGGEELIVYPGVSKRIELSPRLKKTQGIVVSPTAPGEAPTQ
ncbi:MAG: hypothetical protein ACOZNI_16855 [Myxococcota bacterium]